MVPLRYIVKSVVKDFEFSDHRSFRIIVIFFLFFVFLLIDINLYFAMPFIVHEARYVYCHVVDFEFTGRV